MSSQKQEHVGRRIYGGSETKTVQQEREEVYAALQYADSSHCLVEEWKDCEEFKQKPKEKCIFVDKEAATVAIEKFITGGNERADEQAKEGTMDGGGMAQVRAITKCSKVFTVW